MPNPKRRRSFGEMMKIALGEFKQMERPMQILAGVDAAIYALAFLLAIIFLLGYKEPKFIVIIILLLGVANLLNSIMGIKDNKKRAIRGIIIAILLIAFGCFLMIGLLMGPRT